jgi:hypothetical protein
VHQDYAYAHIDILYLPYVRYWFAREPIKKHFNCEPYPLRISIYSRKFIFDRYIGVPKKLKVELYICVGRRNQQLESTIA